MKYTFLVLLTGYHLMELDMIKISLSGILNEFSHHEKTDTFVPMLEFKKIYSSQMIIGIPATVFWGWFSDKFGNFKTASIHLIAHIVVTVLIAHTRVYDYYFYLCILLSFFSNYVISLSTFTGWIPEKGRASFNARSQFFSTLMLQLAPFLSGIISNQFSGRLVYSYHMILAAVLSVFLSGFVYAFKGYNEEQKAVSKKEQSESDELKGFSGYLTIMKNKTAASLIFLGIYLRLVKKLVDVAFHLWAEVSTENNGLGYDKVALGSYSSFGGILSVMLYLVFAKEEISSMPQQMNMSFILLAITTFLFPLLSLTNGWLLDAGLVILILVFNYTFSVLFTCWIGLINEGVRKEIRSKSFAMTLAIRSIIGTYLSNKAFDLIHWSLDSPVVTSYLGGRMNSAVFFWLFTLINLGMYGYFRKLKLEKKDKKYELVF